MHISHQKVCRHAVKAKHVRVSLKHHAHNRYTYERSRTLLLLEPGLRLPILVVKSVSKGRYEMLWAGMSRPRRSLPLKGAQATAEERAVAGRQLDVRWRMLQVGTDAKNPASQSKSRTDRRRTVQFGRPFGNTF